jgi:hypothetical protein
MKLPRRNFLHLAAGAAALPAVSRLTWAQNSDCLRVRLVRRRYVRFWGAPDMRRLPAILVCDLDRPEAVISDVSAKGSLRLHLLHCFRREISS